jgi:cytoskeletal protein CcmA (bactofilin family)
MFSKPARPGQSGAETTAAKPSAHLAPARKTPKVASLIADDIVIEGHVVGEGELHVDGVIRGDVRVPRLSIGESGRVEGAIEADTVEARGRVVGSITARQVKLAATSHIDGDITHEQLTMETGAFFQGRSLKFTPQPSEAPTVATPLPASATKSLKDGPAVTH